MDVTRTIRRFLLTSVTALLCCAAYAQDQQQQQQQQPVYLTPPHPSAKMGVRYEIDAKRMGVDPNSEDALPRSREFKRIDSSYYVGWFFEGAYKYNHAADYLGFKNASVPLERALRLMERDYRKSLATRTSDIMSYITAYKFQMDYTMIAYYLMNCYSNMEDPQRVFDLLRRVVKLNFQRDYYMDAYNYLAWTVHRNRFYTSAKYPFLKNSIDENEKLAHRYLDSQMRRININRGLNQQIFPPGYEQQEKQGVYHYKAILHGYAFNIDSTNHYFNLMRNTPIFSHNNFATWQVIIGNFRNAYKEYAEAATQDPSGKHLQEWAYYTSIMDIYRAKPKAGVNLSRDMITATGSTPGFGWYNIGLSRSLLYDGQVAESERTINKAAEFKELHIGTTLGQSHYDFSVQLMKLMAKEARLEMQVFENSNWWYNPKALGKMAQLYADKYMQQFLIINQFAQNPERDRVIYKLFSSESTVSWDEVWYLIRDFSTQFFLDRFKKEAQTTNRTYIRKYFQLFVARLYMKQDNYTEARKILDGLLQDANIDQEYEQLFIARVYQAQAECAKKREDDNAYSDWVYRMYQLYPQLVPFTGLQMNMNLHVSGAVDDVLVSRLKDCNIKWGLSNTSVEAFMIFTNKGKSKHIEYYVLDRNGKYIVPKQSCSYKGAEQAGIEMAYRLCNIGGNLPERESDVEKNSL